MKKSKFKLLLERGKRYVIGILTSIGWRNHQTEEATWEWEDEIKEKHPALRQEFETFEDESSFF